MTITRRVIEGAARRSRIERANDVTLEWVILALRGLGGVCTLGWLASVVAVIWTADLRWLATMAFLLIVGAAASWLGYWTFGNEEWRHGPTDR